MTIEISGGQYLNEYGDWTPFKSLLVREGRIIAIDQEGERDTSQSIRRTINAEGKQLLPGLIDLNAHLQEPGSSRNGTIKSETMAALAGGVTTLCSRPDTQPVNDSKAITQLIVELNETKAHCTVLPLGALTKDLKGEHLSGYSALKDAGCIALSNAFKPLQSLLITQRCFEYAKTHELCVMVNPIEPSLHQGSMHEGELSTITGLQGIPATAETVAVAQLLELARATGVKLHLSQLSSEGSVNLLRQAKAAGAQVSADVSVANLAFTDKKIGYFDSLFHCMPPLRAESDRQALVQGVIDGTIDAISSGHCPLEAAEKQKPFSESAPGMSLLEVLLPLAIQLEADGLPLSRFVEAMSVNAGKILALPDAAIKVGTAANLSIFDRSARYVLSPDKLMSKGANNPLVGQEVQGRVCTTMLAGEIVFEVTE